MTKLQIIRFTFLFSMQLATFCMLGYAFYLMYETDKKYPPHEEAMKRLKELSASVDSTTIRINKLSKEINQP